MTEAEKYVLHCATLTRPMSEIIVPDGYWWWVFGDHDGYDCMSAAYSVYRGRKLMFEIDVVPFISGIDEPDFDWDVRHAPNLEAETLARTICQRMQST